MLGKNACRDEQECCASIWFQKIRSLEQGLLEGKKEKKKEKGEIGHQIALRAI
jgi:hypothetical protein